MITDQLVECLEKLMSTLIGDEDPEVFIDRVAEEYLMCLVKQAHIPFAYLANLRDDVRTEIHDLLRIRSYGYPSLKEYLAGQAQSIRRPNT